MDTSICGSECPSHMEPEAIGDFSVNEVGPPEGPPFGLR